MRPWELENAEWIKSFKASTISRRHQRGTIKRQKKPKRPKDFFGNNSFCIDNPSHKTNLTKHHLTRKEKRELKISVDKTNVWIWLCRNCHNKRHNIKPRQQGRVVQKQDSGLTIQK